MIRNTPSKVLIVPLNMFDSILTELVDLCQDSSLTTPAINEILVSQIVEQLMNYDSNNDRLNWSEAFRNFYAYHQAYHSDVIPRLDSIATSISRLLDVFTLKLIETSDIFKYHGKPEIRISDQHGVLRVNILCIHPPTDYVGEMQKLVDAARERGEFIPYKCLEFIAKC